MRMPGLLCVAAWGLLIGCAGPSGGREVAGAIGEVRASWVVRTGILSPAAVAQVVDEAVRAGLNTLVVQVRGRGDAHYRSELEPFPPPLRDGAFDPLKAILELARRRGLRVHAWMNANLVSDPRHPNPDPRHLVSSHPEWLMFPSALAEELGRLPPADPEVAARLARFALDRPRVVEGVYADPAIPAVRAHLAAVCADLARRYPVDGIHLDYIRYPGPEWGYSPAVLEAFAREVRAVLSPDEAAEMAMRASTDPLAYTRRYPRRWDAFRRQAVSEMVRDVAAAVRAARPGILLSAAVIADRTRAQDAVLQDWPRWLEAGWLDVACPMVYTVERATFEAQVKALLAIRGLARMWIGIGAWRLEPTEILDRISFARDAGADGILLFSHASLGSRPELLRLLLEGPFRPSPREP